MSSVGGNSAVPAGTVTMLGGDAPVCDVLSFSVTILGATLTPKGGGAAVPVITSSNTVTEDFAALMDFSTALNLSSVVAGTYSQITLTLSNPQLVVLNTTTTPASQQSLSTSLTANTLTVDIDPPLTLSASGSAVLNVDFKLRKSIQTDSQGQVTGTVNPVFKVSAKNLSASDDDEEEGGGDKPQSQDSDLEGIVQSVSTTSSDSSFVGSFMIKNESSSTFTVQVASKTEFDDLSGGLAALAGMTMPFVEVEAFTDSKGNVVAKDVEVEQQEENRAAFRGVIMSATRDVSGNVTEFNLFVRGEDPDESACVPPRTTATVNVSSITTFGIAAKRVNVAQLTLAAANLGVGQEVVVHGPCTAGMPPSINAAAVFLKLQTVLGNFSQLLSAQSDGQAGGFVLVPCGGIFNGSLITVVTAGETAFAEINGLNDLMAQPELAVRGLLFYELQTLTVGGVTVNGTVGAPVAVLEAKQVHQFGAGD
jgi:uncharacterized protein DUF4382